MLISLFEDTNAVKFSSILDTTLTIPKNATIRLNKAFIPRNHIVRIDATNDCISVNFHNERQSESLNLTLTQGDYGIQGLVAHINSLAAATITAKGTGQFSDFVFELDYDRSLGVEAGCLALELRGNSPYADFWATVNWSRDTASQDWFQDFSKVAGASDTYTIPLSNDDMRCSVLSNGGADIKSWNNHWGLNKVITRTWWGATKTVVPGDSDRPMVSNNWSGFKFAIGDAFTETGKDNSFWVGVTEDLSQIDMSSIANTDLSAIVGAKGLIACAVFYGETANGKTKGDLEIFEDFNGTFTSVKLLATGVGTPIKGDEFAICLPENLAGDTEKTIQYRYKQAGGAGDWRYVPVPNLQARPKPASTTNLYMCGGFYNGSGTDVTINNMKFGGDPNMSFEAGALNTGSGFFSHYGRAGKIYLTGARNNNKNIKEDLGFQEDNYGRTEGNPANILSVDFPNETEPIHYDNSANQPFINLNITNLPIDSISCAATDSTTLGPGQVHHSASKTISALPRYNADGDGLFTNVTIQADAQNEPTIRLNNASEITLNSLDFELRNGDGTVPTDLGLPLGIVLDIKQK